MITEEHLRHWLSEITYANNGISGNINQDGMKNHKVISAGGATLSLDYIREKVKAIEAMIECIKNDMEADGKVK